MARACHRILFYLKMYYYRILQKEMEGRRNGKARLMHVMAIFLQLYTGTRLVK